MSNDFIERIEWLHCLMQEMEDAGVELPMGDYGDVYDIIETARDTSLAPTEPFTPTIVQDPKLVDVSGQQTVAINVMHANIVIGVTSEGIIMDFWDDESDGEPHATVGMTFEEWRDFADRSGRG